MIYDDLIEELAPTCSSPHPGEEVTVSIPMCNDTVDIVLEYLDFPHEWEELLENSGADTMGDLVDYLCYCSQNNISLAIFPEDEEKLYANQVLPDNGAGLSTRYAHMTQTAVTAGEAVTAGQVIGYVGNTGDSTGNHLHFEVMQNGVRVNPMDMVSVR